MKTDIDHLPPAKQRELDRAIQIIFEEFGDTQNKTVGETKLGRILKIILFGTYGRGGWVYEPHTAKGYRSDFDLLIIVNLKELTDRAKYWARAEERLNRELLITHTLKTPVNFIVHTLRQVNDGLAHGRYFFMDIARDGIALYQSDDKPLHTPTPKTPQASLELAEEYFEEWFRDAMEIYEGAKFHIAKQHYKRAAFDLHQTAEALYHCVLLTTTFYTPHVHNLSFLRAHAERESLKLASAWPRETQKDRARFEKLKDAYVKARYSKHYRITPEDLDWLTKRVEELGRIVQDICGARINELRTAAKPASPASD